MKNTDNLLTLWPATPVLWGPPQSPDERSPGTSLQIDGRCSENERWRDLLRTDNDRIFHGLAKYSHATFHANSYKLSARPIVLLYNSVYLYFLTMVSVWIFVLLLALVYDYMIMYVGLFGHSAVVFHVQVYLCFTDCLCGCVFSVTFYWSIQLYSCQSV